MATLPKRLEENNWEKPATLAGMAAGTGALAYGANTLRHAANPLGALPPRTPAPPGMIARVGGTVARTLAKPLGVLARHPVAAAIGSALIPNNSIATDEQEMQHMQQAANYDLPEGYAAATPEERGKMLANPDYIARTAEQTVMPDSVANPAAETDTGAIDTRNPAAAFERTIQRPAAGTGGPSQWSREDNKGNYARGEIPDVSGMSDLELANDFMRGHVDRWNAAPNKPGVTPGLEGRRGFGGYASEDKVPWDMQLSNGFTVRQMVDAKKNMGNGTFSVRGGGADGVSPEQWNNLSQQEATSLRVRDLEGQIAAQQQLNAVRQARASGGGGGGGTGPSSIAQPQRSSGGGGVTVAGAPSWDEALKDYAAGRVGSEGYNMIRNMEMKGRQTSTTDGGNVVKLKNPLLDMVGNITEADAYGKARQAGRGAGGDGVNSLDANRFLLDQNKFGYQQAKDARELALQERTLDQTTGAARAERRDGFMEGFLYPDDNAPQEQLGALTWQLSESSGGAVPPEIMSQYIQKAAEVSGVDWKNAPPESLVALGEEAMKLARKDYGG